MKKKDYCNLNTTLVGQLKKKIDELKESQKKLKKRFNIEKTISQVSSYFVNPKNFDRAVNYALRDIGTLAGASRAYLFILDSRNTMSNTHEWCAQGVFPQLKNLQNLKINTFPWWMEKLKNNKVIHVEDVSQLPPRAKAEKKILQAQDIKSVLVLPVYNHSLLGFIGLDNTRETSSWQPEDISLLIIVSEIIGQSFEKNKAEENLRDSEDKFKTIFEKSADGILIADTQTKKFVDANAQVCKLTGYSKKELLQKKVLDIHPKKDLPYVLKEFKLQSRGKKTLAENIPLLRKDKKIVYVDVNSVPIAIKGRPYLLGVFRNVTEKRKSKEALKESEKRYHSLFKNMLNGFAYCQMIFNKNNKPMDFVYLEVNDAFKKLTGLKNVVGKKVTEIIPGIKKAHPELFDIYGRVALTGKNNRFTMHFKPLGLWLSISAYCPHKGYFIAVFNDITPYKKIEEKCRQKVQQLKSQLIKLRENKKRK